MGLLERIRSGTFVTDDSPPHATPGRRLTLREFGRWFVSADPGFRAIALAQTPVALKRRGILWPARSMRRV